MPQRARRKFGASQKERIFFACLPGTALAARIHAMAEELKAEKGFEANLILPEHLHVTLFHLGDWAALPDEVVRLAKEAASQVKAARFEVAFARAESFRNRTGVYPFVLTSEIAPWQGFHSVLGATLQKIGLGGATKGEFKPHMTLTYDELRVKPMAVATISWTVRDFVLVHSQLGKTTHNHLGRWTLS